ncbi:hypothetical protein Scep_025679 [Stephania cephalantha]|uniref:Uncharacterized protein n=1 Tax=Stephania cephalantha TaxID=152367 RepID=A0AAP0EIN1_9MAGN
MQWIEDIQPPILPEKEESIDLWPRDIALFRGLAVDMNSCRSLIGICYETI